MAEQVGFLPRDRAWHPRAAASQYKSTSLRAPRRPLVMMPQSMSETTGPVFGHDAFSAGDDDLINNYAHGGEAIGERIVVHGRVIDQHDRPVRNALIEIWQANAGGRYRHVRDGYLAPLDPNFGGCGRCLSGEDGAYSFRTVRPGPYPYPNDGPAWRPAHIHLSVFGHAFCQRLITQLYFEGDPLVRVCPIVNSVSNPAAVEMLIARLDLEAAEPFDSLAYRFDIVLRGRSANAFAAA